MEYDVQNWLKERGYKTENNENGFTVSDESGKAYTLDTAGFNAKNGVYMASPDNIHASLQKSGVGAPSGYTPLRNTLAASGVSVGYDAVQDAPIVGGQLLNKNDSRLMKVGDDYYIKEDYAKSFIPKPFENPYKEQIDSILSALTKNQFLYDPEKDTALAAAQDAAMLAAKQSANSRGLLGGSTAEIMRQRAAADLIPKYEQLAYSRYAADRAAKQETLSILSGLYENAFSEYKHASSKALDEKKLANDAQEAADTKAYQTKMLAQNAAEAMQNQAAKTFSNQLAKVIAMGEVDKDAAEVLGIPEGTLTFEQKQFMEKLRAAAEADAASAARAEQEKADALAKEQREWKQKQALIKLQTDEKIRAALATKLGR